MAILYGEAREKQESGDAEDKAHAYENEQQQTGRIGTLETNDAWLRAKGAPAKPSLRILGSNTAALQRDLKWWMPDGAAKVIQLHTELEGEGSNIHVESHRVVGFTTEVDSVPATHRYKRKSPQSPPRRICPFSGRIL
jgi:hypothetical protein